jgi:hypothetical protein
VADAIQIVPAPKSLQAAGINLLIRRAANNVGTAVGSVHKTKTGNPRILP